MKTVTVMAMDIGDGMLLYMNLLHGKRVCHSGLEFNITIEGTARMARVICNWCTLGVLAS